MLDSGYYFVPQGRPTNQPDGEANKISTELPPVPTPEETPPVDEELDLAELVPPVLRGSPSRTPSSPLAVEPPSLLSTFTEPRAPHSHERSAKSRRQTPAKLALSHWELRPTGTQTWVECLNEWRDKVGARLDWHCSVSQGSAHTWRAVPTINGEETARCTGEAPRTPL
ncbi:hypothetical protein RSOLAG22IIIB_03679 [Rhizoctonia solani]|uniref:Uncharacterized protein n=1 Tax=Rhizoctonia solani TaxID=456999 RepID=A0A0K6FS46_9AGAM|nr:hypothetical protein RSOLAG22IIIB_03679 [Rhizoctonia solani]